MFVSRLCFPDISDNINRHEGKLEEIVRELKTTRAEALKLFESESYSADTHWKIVSQEGSLRTLGSNIRDIKSTRNGCCKSVRKVMQFTLYGTAGLYLAAEGMNAYVDIYDECRVPVIISVARKVILASCASMAAGYTYLNAQEEMRARAEVMLEVIDEQIWNHKLFKKLHIKETFPGKIEELGALIKSGKADGRSRSLLSALTKHCPQAHVQGDLLSSPADSPQRRINSVVEAFIVPASENLMNPEVKMQRKMRAKTAFLKRLETLGGNEENETSISISNGYEEKSDGADTLDTTVSNSSENNHRTDGETKDEPPHVQGGAATV